MASEYTYDDEGETWPFFVLALLCFILIPLSIRWVLRAMSSESKLVNTKIDGSVTVNRDELKLDNHQHIERFHSKQKSGKIFNKTLLFLIIGWSIFAYIGLNFTKEVNLKGAFDPYHILDVSMTASEREIKSKYRKLSLKFHPDKLAKGLSETERQDLEQQFVIINMAYKSLTDEVTRNNFIKYGHPDGPQDVKHGIALPTFLVDSKYSSLIVVFYFLMIGGLLPYIVGSWWSNVKSHTKKGLHVETAALFTRKLIDRNPSQIVTPFSILDWILQSQEVKTNFENLNHDQIKNLIALHLNRNYDPEFEDDKLRLIAILPRLISGFIDIATAFRQTEVVLPAADLLKSITSAVKPVGKHQELLQLPFVNPEVVESQNVKKLGKLMTLPKDEAKKVLGITDDNQLNIALEVAQLIPSLRIIEAKFVVPGEPDVYPNCSAHLSLKFLVKSPRLKSCPIVKESDLVDEETMEYLRDPFIVNEKEALLPFSFAPYYPNPFRNKWIGFLIAQQDNKLVENSEVAQLTNINLSNMKLTQEEWMEEGKAKISTFKVPFSGATPGTLGTTAFRLVLKNNTYFGVDVDIPVTMDVKPMPVMKKPVKKLAEEDSDSESDISDPEEDGIAAALKALNGMVDGTPEKIQELEEGEDEDEEVFTDIDTETEDEAEK